jgi:hypothetical protein
MLCQAMTFRFATDHQSKEKPVSESSTLAASAVGPVGPNGKGPTDPPWFDSPPDLGGQGFSDDALDNYLTFIGDVSSGTGLSVSKAWKEKFGSRCPARRRCGMMMRMFAYAAPIFKGKPLNVQSMTTFLNHLLEQMGSADIFENHEINTMMEHFEHPDRDNIWRLNLLGYSTQGKVAGWVAVAEEKGYKISPADTTIPVPWVNGVDMQSGDPVHDVHGLQANSTIQKLNAASGRHHTKRIAKQGIAQLGLMVASHRTTFNVVQDQKVMESRMATMSATLAQLQGKKRSAE